jgi:hypothetical protein
LSKAEKHQASFFPVANCESLTLIAGFIPALQRRLLSLGQDRFLTETCPSAKKGKHSNVTGRDSLTHSHATTAAAAAGDDNDNDDDDDEKDPDRVPPLVTEDDAAEGDEEDDDEEDDDDSDTANIEAVDEGYAQVACAWLVLAFCVCS